MITSQTLSGLVKGLFTGGQEYDVWIQSDSWDSLEPSICKFLFVCFRVLKFDPFFHYAITIGSFKLALLKIQGLLPSPTFLANGVSTLTVLLSSGKDFSTFRVLNGIMTQGASTCWDQ